MHSLSSHHICSGHSLINMKNAPQFADTACVLLQPRRTSSQPAALWSGGRRWRTSCGALQRASKWTEVLTTACMYRRKIMQAVSMSWHSLARVDRQATVHMSSARCG